MRDSCASWGGCLARTYLRVRRQPTQVARRLTRCSRDWRDRMILDGLDLATDEKVSDHSQGIGACGKDEDKQRPAELLTLGEPPGEEAFGAFSLSEARTDQLTLEHVP